MFKKCYAIVEITLEALKSVITALFYRLLARVVFLYRLPVIECFIARLHQQPIIVRARDRCINGDSLVNMVRA